MGVAPTQVLVRPDRVLRQATHVSQSTSGIIPLPATVPDQTEVLDLSSSSRHRPSDQTAPAPIPTLPVTQNSISGVNTTPAHAHNRHVSTRDTNTTTPLSLVGALRRLGTNVNLVPVNFSMTSRSRSQSPSTVTVSRAETDSRHRDRSHSPSIVTVSHRWSHRSQRDRSVPSDRHRHHHHHHRSSTSSSSVVASSQAVIERLGGASSSSSSRHSHGVAMPLAEATRLLNNSWDTESVRQADMFINSLAAVPVGIAASSSSSVPLLRQNSSPAASNVGGTSAIVPSFSETPAMVPSVNDSAATVPSAVEVSATVPSINETSATVPSLIEGSATVPSISEGSATVSLISEAIVPSYSGTSGTVSYSSESSTAVPASLETPATVPETPDYYNPAVPTDDSTDSSDSNTLNNPP